MIPSAVHQVNLALAFLLELAVLVAVGYWGFTLDAHWAVRVLAGIGAPLLLAVLWGLFASPKATYPLHGFANAAFQTGWFGSGGVALVLAGRTLPGVLLFAVWLANTLILRLPHR